MFRRLTGSQSEGSIYGLSNDSQTSMGTLDYANELASQLDMLLKKDKPLPSDDSASVASSSAASRSSWLGPSIPRHSRHFVDALYDKVILPKLKKSIIGDYVDSDLGSAVATPTGSGSRRGSFSTIRALDISEEPFSESDISVFDDSGSVSSATSSEPFRISQHNPPKPVFDPEAHEAGPDLSIPLLLRNIAELSKRAGGVMKTQTVILKAIQWQNPCLSISCIFIYTAMCMYPGIVFVLPGLLFMYGIMAPAYAEKHPLPKEYRPSPWIVKNEFDMAADDDTSIRAAQIKRIKAAEKKPVDVKKSMKNFQNATTNLIKALDKLESFLTGPAGFANESLSALIFLLIGFAMIGTFFLSAFIPWKALQIGAGWGVIIAGHPTLLKRIVAILDELEKTEDDEKPKESPVLAILQKVQKKEFINDEPPQGETVEIFELQRQGLTPRQWDSWVFTSLVYDLGSSWRQAKKRPPGAPFLADVEAPEGWLFSKMHDWEVDMNPQEWVGERGLGRCTETDDDEWVYDVEKGVRGEWRRRRFIRTAFKESTVPKELLGLV
ncbi:Peroxisomal membrane protein [Yarrowia sp. C11]|nr:Peroxisomal membrane protein [Yarrowia sp. C11]